MLSNPPYGKSWKVDAGKMGGKKGNPQADTKLTDTEQIPFTYDGGIDAFFEKEVKPYAKDAWIDRKQTKTGYEISFTRYFYKPIALRPLEEITADIKAIEAETKGLLEKILGD
jgi:type I restriction enzyme M protein